MSQTIRNRSTALAIQLGAQFAKRCAGHDAADTFVAANYDLLKEQRVFAALVPADLGGGDWSHEEMCTFLRMLAGYCGSTALALAMHQHLVAAQVWNYKHDKPGRVLLERVAKEQTVLVTTGGRDWMESNGTMEKVDGGFCVTAKKTFASGSPVGAIMITSAPYQDPVVGWQVLHFPVPMAEPKVKLLGDWKALGMRGTGSQTVLLDGVFVPEQAVVLRRPRGEFHTIWGVVLTVAMPLIMSVYLGIADAAAARARVHARNQPGADDATAITLGAMENHHTAAMLAVESMIALANNLWFSPGIEIANAILVRKSIAARETQATVEAAMEACGGASFYREFELERLFRDVYAGHYHPLPEIKQQLMTGRLTLGRNPMTGAQQAHAQAAD